MEALSQSLRFLSRNITPLIRQQALLRSFSNKSNDEFRIEVLENEDKGIELLLYVSFMEYLSFFSLFFRYLYLWYQ